MCIVKQTSTICNAQLTIYPLLQQAELQPYLASCYVQGDRGVEGLGRYLHN